MYIYIYIYNIYIYIYILCIYIFREKAPLQNVRLGSKYALASGRYWQEKLIVEKKLKKSLTLIWKQEKKLL